MSTRIIVNGKEITNPYIRALLILGAIAIAGVVSAFVIFVLLPIIGVAVTLSLGFIFIFLIASLVSVMTLLVVSIIISWLFGAAEVHIEKRLK